MADPTSEQIIELDAKLTQTIHSVDELRPEVAESNRRSKTSQLVAVIGIVVGAVGLAAAGFAIWAIREVNSSRAEARYVACVTDNIEQLGDRNSAANGALVMFGYAEPGNLTEEDRAAIVNTFDAELRERYRQVVQQAAFDHPYRRCTPPAISDFYKNPLPDPGAAEFAEEAG